MPHYLVKIRGRNFLLKLRGKWERLSFFTHRLAHAPDPLLAKHEALEDFRTSRKFQMLITGMLYAENDPPKLEAEEIREVSPEARFEQGLPGLVFYEETSDENGPQSPRRQP